MNKWLEYMEDKDESLSLEHLAWILLTEAIDRGIECGPGWYPLIAVAYARMVAIDPGFKVAQVKEKYGGLRFYWDPSDFDVSNEVRHELSAIQDWAEEASLHICENCGDRETATPRVSHEWYATLCDTCAGDGWERVSDVGKAQ